MIRRTTASALGACLEMVAQREGDHCQQLYAGVYNSALQRVGSSSDAVSTPTNRLGLRSVTGLGIDVEGDRPSISMDHYNVEG